MVSTIIIFVFFGLEIPPSFPSPPPLPWVINDDRSLIFCHLFCGILVFRIWPLLNEFCCQERKSTHKDSMLIWFEEKIDSPSSNYKKKNEETIFWFINPLLLLLYLTAKVKPDVLNPHYWNKSMIIAPCRMQLFPWAEQFSVFTERKCIRMPWYFCFRGPENTQLCFHTRFWKTVLPHQIRWRNRGFYNLLLD